MRGSIGNDSLKSSGLNVTLDGDDGDDTLVGGTGSDTFIYALGDGNDVIINYDAADLIRLSSGRINAAALDGNDVVMSLDGGSIRLKDAKGKSITFIKPNGKTTSFVNEYQSLSTEQLASAKDFLDRLEAGLASKLKASATADGVPNKSTILDDLKNQLKPSSSIPDRVFEEIADAITKKLNDSLEVYNDEYPVDLLGTRFTRQIGAEILSGFDSIPSRTVTINGVKYTIDFTWTVNFWGQSANFIQVTSNAGLSEMIAFNTSDAEVYAQYCLKLKTLSDTANINVRMGFASDIVSTYAKILTTGGNELTKYLGTLANNPVFKDIAIFTVKQKLQEMVSTFEDGDELLYVASRLENLRYEYNNIDEVDDYTMFIEDGNKIAKTLGVEKVPTGGGIWDWFRGLFNELPATQTDYWFTQSDMSSGVSDLDSIIDNNLMGNKNAVADQLIRTTAENIFPVHEIVGVKESRHKKFYGLK